jgi:hypothetical protein
VLFDGLREVIIWKQSSRCALQPTQNDLLSSYSISIKGFLTSYFVTAKARHSRWQVGLFLEICLTVTVFTGHKGSERKWYRMLSGEVLIDKSTGMHFIKICGS